MSITLQPGAAAPSGEGCCAEVRAHDRVMHYRRSGKGPYLIALADPASDALVSAHLEALSGSFRVIVPQLPRDSADDGTLARWLGEFMEGLGLPEVTLLAAGNSCVPAVEAALSCDAVRRLVLLSGRHGAAESLDGRLEPAASMRVVPVTIVRGQVEPAELARRLAWRRGLPGDGGNA